MFWFVCVDSFFREGAPCGGVSRKLGSVAFATGFLEHIRAEGGSVAKGGNVFRGHRGYLLVVLKGREEVRR